MQSFITQLTQHLYTHRQAEMKDLCIVFPTRRAGLFFKDELSKLIDKPVWSPAVYSIQDFILKMNNTVIPDQLTLLFELYKVYQKYFPAESFDRFYPWGELLLKDFNDLDNYLVSADKVFSTVTDIHDIETAFALPEEELIRIRNFWQNFFDHDPSRLKNEFMNTWKHLSGIFRDFTKALEDQNQAYDGMAYRKISEALERNEINIPEEYNHVVFAGFYALSPAEEKIFNYFIKEKKATTYFDADKYYTDDATQEAGKFFRNNKLIEKNYNWKGDYFGSTKKTITTTGIPLLVGQAKYAGQLIQELMKQKDFVPERTAIVLPDEKLLFPVLYALPEEVKHVNVTMGYPLRQTPLFDLFEALINLQKNARQEKGTEVSFYFRDIKSILNHPYIRIISREPIRKWLQEIDENFIRIEASLLTGAATDALFKELFYIPPTLHEVFDWMRRILQLILLGMKEGEFRFHKLESEFVFHFYTHLKRLEDIFKENDIEVDIQTFRKIFRELISTVKIPFTGEPLKGLQIMGFLETRVLDFDHVIVLSVNEDTLPAAGNQPSFIPFNIRKAFGLPTFEEQHAVSAYHFYRLLQRSADVQLVYNTEPSNLTGGERSRFLLQLEYELQKKHPEQIQLIRKVVSTQVQKEKSEAIVIEKTPQVLNELSKYLKAGDKLPGSALSPSGLGMYISCSLKFYFRYVAGLKEIEESEDNMEAATFGTVLHRAMQLLYTGIPELNPESIKACRKKIDATVDQAIHEEFVAIHHLEGKNILLRNVIRRLIHRLLDTELMNGNVRLLQLEKDVSTEYSIDPEKTVNLYGIIDRLDKVQDRVRIIDYKTGKVIKRKNLDMEKLFSDPKSKEQFQAMYYAFLTAKEYQNVPLVSGLFILRELTDGIWFLNQDMPFTQDQFSEFNDRLKRLIGEIFDPAIPFSQTEDEQRCEYCAFAEICNRN